MGGCHVSRVRQIDIKRVYLLLLRVLGGALLAALIGVAALFVLFYVPNPDETAPRVLVSVDRTLWNGLGLNRLTYVRKLRLAGLQTVIVKFPEDGRMPKGLFDDVAGLVLTGGGDVAAERYGGNPNLTIGVKPARDTFELALLEAAEKESLPTLGLCRGAQLVNVYLGGTLGDLRDEPRFDTHRNALAGHAVEIEPGSRLANIYGTEHLKEITTWHGQYVGAPGRGVVVTAFSPDGTPEALEVEGDWFVVGVQWHAEMPPWDKEQDRLFAGFAKAVRGAD